MEEGQAVAAPPSPPIPRPNDALHYQIMTIGEQTAVRVKFSGFRDIDEFTRWVSAKGIERSKSTGGATDEMIWLYQNHIVASFLSKNVTNIYGADHGEHRGDALQTVSYPPTVGAIVGVPTPGVKPISPEEWFVEKFKPLPPRYCVPCMRWICSVIPVRPFVSAQIERRIIVRTIVAIYLSMVIPLMPRPPQPLPSEATLRNTVNEIL